MKGDINPLLSFLYLSLFLISTGMAIVVSVRPLYGCGNHPSLFLTTLNPSFAYLFAKFGLYKIIDYRVSVLLCGYVIASFFE